MFSRQSVNFVYFNKALLNILLTLIKFFAISVACLKIFFSIIRRFVSHNVQNIMADKNTTEEALTLSDIKKKT